MSYREAFLFGWSLAWRQILWSLAAGVPLALLVASVFTRGTIAFGLAFYPLFVILMLLVILPYSIRAAIAQAFRTFRVQLKRQGIFDTPTYADALQISVLATIVSLVLGALYTLIELPNVRLGLLAEVPLLLFVIYPAIAEAAVNVPFRGFRLTVSRWNPTASCKSTE